MEWPKNIYGLLAVGLSFVKLLVIYTEISIRFLWLIWPQLFSGVCTLQRGECPWLGNFKECGRSDSWFMWTL